VAEPAGTNIGAVRGIPLFGSVIVTVPAVVAAAATRAIFHTRIPKGLDCMVCPAPKDRRSVSTVHGIELSEFAIG
jgi:hypothetical protein